MSKKFKEASENSINTINEKEMDALEAATSRYNKQKEEYIEQRKDNYVRSILPMSVKVGGNFAKSEIKKEKSIVRDLLEDQTKIEKFQKDKLGALLDFVDNMDAKVETKDV